ncbi:MAG: lipid A deacylase LpxR family protein [Prosthecobacter sp.]
MKKIALLLLTLSATAGLGRAQDADIDPTRLGTLSFYLENDTIASTDENYTSGAFIGYTSPGSKHYSDTSRLGGIFDGLTWTGGGEYERHVAFGIGQQFFTPVDTRTRALLEGQRPYAGWLYGSFGLVWKSPKVKNSLIFNIGVVGPWARAEETQRYVHERLGQSYPEGWDNQIGNEIGINMAYEKKWRIRDREDASGFDWDVLPYFGASLGNVNTSANIGTEIRFGYNIPDDFGSGGIAETASTPTAVNDPAYAKPWRRPFGMHLFARAEGRGVLRNIFLDGNTFRESHSVDKYPFVADLSAGFALNYKNTKMVYALVYRTKEFDGQQGGQVFGSVSLNFNF